jgi:hypothetical protein
MSEMRYPLVRMTNGQIGELFKARFGRLLAPQQLARLKGKFITRGERLASAWEALRLEVEGVRGKPSLYRATGLAEVLG